MIVVEDLVRDFRGAGRRGKPRRALNGLSLHVGAGETFGLLGPNGAGKTTLTKVLTTLLVPTSGSARVAGFDVVDQAREVRQRIGIVFGGERGLYDRITARQNLVFWGTLAGVRRRQLTIRVQYLLERVGLAERADEAVEGYSRGMRQRLHLARGLVADPDVLFLDEPTSGMDPAAAHDFRSLVREFSDSKTILLTTHDMKEAEVLCNRAALIDRGRIIGQGTTGELRRSLPTQDRVDMVIPAGNTGLIEELTTLPFVRGVHDSDLGADARRVEVARQEDAAVLLRWLLDRGVTTISTSPPSLEEAYLSYIGARGLRL
ncbi:ABC transporter ATP-binding protein [Nocardia sp. NPDC051929]|uniref:ABC transporter ATP-binding protein n=1 Tax=Nocardia sp. NPDC051929 TaxID=3364327 RepID=UPI0037C94ABF